MFLAGKWSVPIHDGVAMPVERIDAASPTGHEVAENRIGHTRRLIAIRLESLNQE
ncbi:hypothetical protein KOEU_14610 [Komagataeibacter europaeus]|uniref:Uncharacterized protein n=1 Tax=Komagataeibacter europaeus TaxID=33995 RepID=A0A0M0EIR2_KOMEU|nr:hypothetical protein S101446_03064 [Komagataeibacter europaeus]KON65162.1 hypothetical protein KOEU_14610 [Komagataeibacter europaeus]